MTHHEEVNVCRTVSGSGLSSNAYLMTCARMEVLAKIGSQLPLSRSHRDLLDERYRQTEAMAHLDRLRECIRAGEFDSALDSARRAASILHNWKLPLAISFLQYAPHVLRAYYRAHEHLLAMRNWVRAARSAPPVGASLPTLSAKQQNR